MTHPTLLQQKAQKQTMARLRILLCVLLTILGVRGQTQVGNTTDAEDKGEKIAISDKSALIIVDVQNCFTPGGTLEVAGGDQVVPIINSIRRQFGKFFDIVVLTQDWHCADHISFASQHSGYNAYDQIQLNYNQAGQLCTTANVSGLYTTQCAGKMVPLIQTLWPDHCVINTTDAEIKDDLTMEPNDVVVRKGYECQVDSYSAFYSNGGYSQTEMDSILSEKGIKNVYITGLATDYCVYWSALDAKKLGYNVYVILDGTRAIADDTLTAAKNDMLGKGVNLINSDDLTAPKDEPTSSAVNNTPYVLLHLLVVITGYLWINS